MTDFATILAQLEELSPPIEPTSVFRRASLESALDESAVAAPQDDANQSFAAVIAAAYGTLSSAEPRDARTAPPSKSTARATRLPDRDALLRQLRLAEGSLDELRALRRRLAWLCHPDRQDQANGRLSEKLMAEFNARIDAAIAKIRRRAAGRSA